MRKSIKRLLVILLGVILTMHASILVFAEIKIPSPTSDFYVNDFAGIFTSSEKSRLVENSSAFSNDHDGVQIVITTVSSLNGVDIVDYSVAMYNQYGIGKNDMGLLIVLSTEDRDIWITVGTAMEVYVNDAKAGKLIDKYALDDLKNNKFSEGLIHLQEGILKELPPLLESTDPVNQQGISRSNGSTDSKIDPAKLRDFLFLSLIIFGSAGLIILVIFMIKKIKRGIENRKEEIANLYDQLSQKEEKIALLRKQRDELQTQVAKSACQKEQINEQCTSLKTTLALAKRVYPDLDKKIEKLIEADRKKEDIARAKEVDEKIQNALQLQVGAKNIMHFKLAISAYLSLTNKQRSYVTSDFNRLKRLYEESVTIQQQAEAKDATDSILSLIRGITTGTASQLFEIERAQRVFDQLDSDAKKYVDSALIRLLERLYREAKKDKKRKDEEEEEERRRRNSYSSSVSSLSSSHSSSLSTSHHSSSFTSHHSGFGGHTSGGGAGRHF